MAGLGWLYQSGRGVPRDYATAREWYEKAAAKGNGAGMANLGWLYRDGLGVPRDYGSTNVNAGTTLSFYFPAPVDRVALTLHPFGGVSIMTIETPPFSSSAKVALSPSGSRRAKRGVSLMRAFHHAAKPPCCGKH